MDFSIDSEAFPAATPSYVTGAIVASVQKRLAGRGLYHGEIDGIVGPKTIQALVNLKTEAGMRARPAPLFQTLPYLFSSEGMKGSKDVDQDKPHLTLMRSLVGLKEVPGAGNNPRIMDLAYKAGVKWYPGDSTPWCAVGLNGVLAEAGMEFLPSALARDFITKDYGDVIAPEDIAPGDLIVFARPEAGPWAGHCEMVDTVNGDGTVWAIGGNVSDQVKRSRRQISDILPNGIRRPRRVQEAPARTVPRVVEANQFDLEQVIADALGGGSEEPPAAA